MFSFLINQNTRPSLYSSYTAEELWTDPHIAKQMLALHLDPDLDMASRNHGFINRSVAWMERTFDLASGPRVLDLGCGPGLYANRLSALGARVCGIDFSEHSLDHARFDARRRGLEVDYRKANYLALEAPGIFDLVMLIYGDFCALGPTQRQTLLAKVKEWLAPEGRMVLDVFSLALFHSLKEESGYEYAPVGGFWAPEPYFLFSTRFKYPGEKVYLDRYSVVMADRERELFNWIQCYDPMSLGHELRTMGWRVEETPGTLAGDDYDSGRDHFGAVIIPSQP